jgi:hypothetical protein
MVLPSLRWPIAQPALTKANFLPEMIMPSYQGDGFYAGLAL